MTRYCIVRDDDCHWYVIPADMMEEWDAWCSLDSDDENSWDPPTWADAIGGSPSTLTFENPEYR